MKGLSEVVERREWKEEGVELEESESGHNSDDFTSGNGGICCCHNKAHVATVILNYWLRLLFLICMEP